MDFSFVSFRSWIHVALFMLIAFCCVVTVSLDLRMSFIMIFFGTLMQALAAVLSILDDLRKSDQ